jgi:SAM-dependent methyltransferase
MFEMDNGWQASANAWITDIGEHGDFGRRYVLDPVMLQRALVRAPKAALDVGCGEGRFCRMLKQHGIEVTGVDPTHELIEAARARDTDSVYLDGSAERLPFSNNTFDLVVSYLSLIDIPNIEEAIQEMARVLVPGGALLIANLNAFNTACVDTGWIKDSAGRRLYYPIDRYLEERSMWVAYRGIRIRNHHRPMSTYMRILLDARLRLSYFNEPLPSDDAPFEKAENYRRVPWFLVMEWIKPKSIFE